MWGRDGEGIAHPHTYVIIINHIHTYIDHHACIGMHKGLIGAVLCLFLLVYAVEAKGFLKNSWDQLGTWVLSRRLHPEGLIAGAPPCSLFTAASSSVHKRTKLHPCGNLANYKVRLSQRIWGSFVTRILQDFYSSNLLLFGPCRGVSCCSHHDPPFCFNFIDTLLHPFTWSKHQFI